MRFQIGDDVIIYGDDGDNIIGAGTVSYLRGDIYWVSGRDIYGDGFLWPAYATELEPVEPLDAQDSGQRSANGAAR